MGEPAANPYLYMAANIAAGLDGMRRQLDPPPPVEADPYTTENQMLPTSLAEAIGALEKDSFFRESFGDTLALLLAAFGSTSVCVVVRFLKRSENGRYEAAIPESPLANPQHVSDWEMREYFEFY